MGDIGKIECWKSCSFLQERKLLIMCSSCSRTCFENKYQDRVCWGGVASFWIETSKSSFKLFSVTSVLCVFCCCSACWLVLQCLLPYYCFAFFLSEKDQSKEKEKKVKKTIPAWATLSASQLARAQKQTQMAATSRPKMDAILTEAIKVSRNQMFLLFTYHKAE